jgi:hypothetical protein
MANVIFLHRSLGRVILIFLVNALGSGQLRSKIDIFHAALQDLLPAIPDSSTRTFPLAFITGE